MKIWEIFSCHIILLLVILRCGNVSGNADPIDEGSLDQVATASAVRLSNTTANHSTLERPFRDVEITTIRYENSNGFVPITPETQTVTAQDQTTFAENYSLDRNFTSEERLSLFIRNTEKSKDENSLENDPFYSTEARIFLSLTQPIMTRRSSDSTDSSSDDFELLRINKDTPSVANYQNFYNSLSGRNRDNVRNQGQENVEHNTQTQFYQDRANAEREKNYFDNRGRSKKMENYPENFAENVAAQSQRNSASIGTSYFSYSQVHDDQNKNGYRETSSVANNFPSQQNFEYNSQKDVKNIQNYRTVPQQNYNQRDVANNQFSVQNTQNVNPIADHTYHQGHPKPKSYHNAHRPRLNLKQQISPKPKTVSHMKSNSDNVSPRSQNYNLNTRHEEAPSYFEHEALFNREENNHNYERLEEAKEVSDENYEYVEITEKPKRYRKQRKRPSDSDDSKRLVKEHRDFDDSTDINENMKPKIRFRQRIRGQKPKTNTWPEHEYSTHDEDTDEGGYDPAAESTVNSETRKQHFYNKNHKSQDNGWANVSPNVEISHSSGIEIDQVGKPKLVLPVKVNLVPVANFDHATALGKSQGFDLSNAVLQNFVTATPIAFNNGPTLSPIASILNTPQSIFSQNIAKNVHGLQNQNIKAQPSVPEVIVGQSTFQNPIQTILVPQQNYQTQQKFGQNVRNTVLTNGQNSYPQTTVQNQIPQPPNFNVIQQNLTPQTVQSHSLNQNPVYSQHQNIVQSFQNHNGNQMQNVQSNMQFNNPHPTTQTFENFAQNSGQSIPNYSLQINSHGFQGQTLPSNQNLYTPQSSVVYSTTPTSYLHNGNLEASESHGKRNLIPGSNGQYLASASLTVGEQIQNQINTQSLRPQVHGNLNQVFGHDNLLPKTREYVQSAEGAPTFVNFNNHNGPGTHISHRDHQAEQISQASNAIAQTYKDQNQQILKVANEIFESTLKQLKQLQRSQTLRTNRFGMQNSQNLEDIHSHNYGLKNVEIINPNMRPSPVDQSHNNPSEISNNFGGIGVTTAFPIFATTGFPTSPRPPILSTIGPLSIHGYVDSLTEIGAKENDLKTSPTTNSKPTPPEQRFAPVLFNPINFVPSIETLKNQKALNSKYNAQQPLLEGLNLVPLVPGGNFYKNSYFAQDDLASKPKLSTDLQKYAEEMFKESLKTIYNTQKWNNDHKAQGSEISSITTSPKGNEDLQNMKFTIPDIKPSKQILEAHFTESGSRDAELQSTGHSSKPSDEMKKLPSQTTDYSDILKPDFKTPPISLEPVRFYYKPNIHLSRPAIADTSNPDFKFNPDLGPYDFIHDFLTPPKPNAFVSKSPFNEFIPKRRPGHKRPNSRPNTGVVEAAASNIAHQSFSFDAPRYEFFHNRPSFDHENQDLDSDYPNGYPGMRGQNFHSKYPSLTTSSPLGDDHHKPGFHNYDYNHPRMHNLMGLLRKNKRLPPGNSQSLFAKKEGTIEPLENKNPPNFQDTSRGLVLKKSDVKDFEMNVNSTQTEKSHT